MAQDGLLLEGGDPADWTDLDRILIPDPAGGRISALIAMSTRFFFTGGETAEARERGIDGMELFADEFGEELTHYITHEGEALPYTRDDAFAYFRSRVALVDPDEATLYLGIAYYVDTPPERKPLDAACVLSAQMPYWAKRNLYSEWSATLPFGWLGPDSFESHIDRVLKWAAIVRPAHGTSCPSFVLDNSFHHQRPGEAIFPHLKRYPGLDYDDGGAWPTIAGLSEKIRGAAWLTILDDNFVGKLGGIEKLQADLGPDCPVHVYDGGLVIQAGRLPKAGDVNKGETPEFYHRVANVVKPIRFEDYGRSSLLYPPEPLDKVEETLKWIRRFD